LPRRGREYIGAELLVVWRKPGKCLVAFNASIRCVSSQSSRGGQPAFRTQTKRGDTAAPTRGTLSLAPRAGQHYKLMRISLRPAWLLGRKPSIGPGSSRARFLSFQATRVSKQISNRLSGSIKAHDCGVVRGLWTLSTQPGPRLGFSTKKNQSRAERLNR
jgi:hypothetical protein